MRVCKHADLRLALRRACNSEGWHATFPPPSPFFRRAHDSFFLTPGAKHPPCCLPLCLSPSAFYPLPLPLSPPVPPSHPFGADKVQTRYQQQGTRLLTRHQYKNKALVLSMCMAYICISTETRHWYKACAWLTHLHQYRNKALVQSMCMACTFAPCAPVPASRSSQAHALSMHTQAKGTAAASHRIPGMVILCSEAGIMHAWSPQRASC